MKKIRIVIADDEPLARDYLRSLLECEPDCEIIAECINAAEAVSEIELHRPDLVFLDVQMPGENGFSVIRRVGPEQMPQTVFVTAHDQYAVRAFDIQALDYLLKPFTEERFREALQRARLHLSLKRGAEWSRRLRSAFESLESEPEQTGAPGLEPARADQVSSIASSEWLSRIPARSGNRVVILRVEEIDWIEAADNYVNIHRGTEIFLVREAMHVLEGQLDPHHFFRIHREAIVNLERVRELHEGPDGAFSVILKSGTKLMLSRRRKGDLEQRLGRRL